MKQDNKQAENEKCVLMQEDEQIPFEDKDEIDQRQIIDVCLFGLAFCLVLRLPSIIRKVEADMKKDEKQNEEKKYALVRDGQEIVLFSENMVGMMYKNFTGPNGLKGFEIKPAQN